MGKGFRQQVRQVAGTPVISSEEKQETRLLVRTHADNRGANKTRTSCGIFWRTRRKSFSSIQTVQESFWVAAEKVHSESGQQHLLQGGPPHTPAPNKTSVCVHLGTAFKLFHLFIKPEIRGADVPSSALKGPCGKAASRQHHIAANK